jgi:hypothetical protein
LTTLGSIYSLTTTRRLPSHFLSIIPVQLLPTDQQPLQTQQPRGNTIIFMSFYRVEPAPSGISTAAGTPLYRVEPDSSAVSTASNAVGFALQARSVQKPSQSNAFLIMEPGASRQVESDSDCR